MARSATGAGLPGVLIKIWLLPAVSSEPAMTFWHFSQPP